MNLVIQKNELHDYVNLLRHKKQEQCGNALHNIIRTMALSRNCRVYQENFTNLDFGNTTLNEIYFASNEEDACTFQNCIFGEYSFTSGHNGAVIAVAWSSDGRYVLSCGTDCKAIIWDTESYLMKKSLIGHQGGVITGVFTLDARYCVTGSSDHTAKIWELQSGTCIRTLRGHGNKVIAVAVSADGNYCLTGSTDRTARLWSMKTGRCIRILRNAQNVSETLQEIKRSLQIRYGLLSDYIRECLMRGGAVSSVAFSPDGRYLLTGSKCETVLWKRDRRFPLYTFEGHPEWITKMLFQPDRDTAFFQSYNDLSSFWKRSVCEFGDLFAYPYDVPLAFSPDGSFFMTFTLEKIYITGQTEERRYQYHEENHVLSMSISSDQRYLLVGKNDGIMEFWDLERQTICKSIKGYASGITAMACTPNGKYLLSASHNGALTLWETETGNYCRTIGNNGCMVDRIVFSENGRCFFTASETGETLSVWDMDSDSIVSSQAYYYSHICVFTDIDCVEVNEIKFNDRNIKIITEHLAAYLGKMFTCLDRGGFSLGWSQFYGHRDGLYAMAISHDGESFIAGFADCTAILVDAEGYRVLKMHKAAVTAVLFSPDRSCCLTGSDDFTAILWDTQTGKRLKTFRIPKEKMADIRWDFPYCYVIKGYSCKVYRISGLDISANVTFVCSIENVSDIHVSGCDFRNTLMDDRTRNILKKNGAILL